jgi:hypothetical protein
MELIRGDCNGEREIAPALRFDSEFRFQRMALLEFAYAKDAEANNAAVLVHPLHNGVILRLTHVSRRIREDDFEKVTFRVEPQFHSGGHTRSPVFRLSVRYAVITNASSTTYFATMHSHFLAILVWE